MSDTTTIVVSVVGAAVGIVGVLGLMLRIVATNIAREFDAVNRRLDDMNKRPDDRINDTNTRIDNLAAETSRRFETLTNEMHQRFDQVSRELGENRERMAGLEGSLEGFLAGRRDRDAA